jgi:hypothetical protein
VREFEKIATTTGLSRERQYLQVSTPHEIQHSKYAQKNTELPAFHIQFRIKRGRKGKEHGRKTMRIKFSSSFIGTPGEVFLTGNN